MATLDYDSPAIRNYPLMVPPAGMRSNFVNPPTLQAPVIAISTICLVFMLPIFLLRLYHRAWATRSFWWDDGASILAVIGSIGYIGCVVTSFTVTGKHMWDVRVGDMTPEILRKEIIGYEMTAGPAIFFAKLSLFLLYLRLFGPNRKARWFIWIGIVASAVAYAATTVAFGVLCLPRAGESWLAATASKRCTDAQYIGYAQGPYGILSDFYLLILPIPAVWQLHMPLKRKLQIIAVFMTGFLACLSSILGFYIRWLIANNPDTTWYMAWSSITVIVEINVGIVCGSVPHVASFFRNTNLKITFLSNSWRKLKSRASKNSLMRTFTSRGRPSSQGSGGSDEAYLKTDILGTIKGEGAFLRTGDWPAPPLHSVVVVRDEGPSTHRERWSD